MTYCENVGEKQWTSHDVNASEYELGDFMYGLVRLVKPGMVLETGCYMGDTTIEIARALRVNDPTGQRGLLNTCDTDLAMVEHTRERVREYPVNVFHQDALSMVNGNDGGIPQRYEMAFIDHSGDRSGVMAALQMYSGGIVVLHDSLREYVVPASWRRVRLLTKRGTDIYET